MSSLREGVLTLGGSQISFAESWLLLPTTCLPTGTICRLLYSNPVKQKKRKCERSWWTACRRLLPSSRRTSPLLPGSSILFVVRMTNIWLCRSVTPLSGGNRGQGKPPAGESLSNDMYKYILYTTRNGAEMLISPSIPSGVRGTNTAASDTLHVSTCCYGAPRRYKEVYCPSLLREASQFRLPLS
jgi:hypothetical protein